MEQTKKQVFVIDDHELVRQGLKQLINGEPDLQVCAEAASVKEVSKLKKTVKPDLAIVDISLPDGNGLDLVKQLRRWRPAMPIIVLSMHDDELFAERALNFGALAYINKQNSAEKLLIGIREVLNNKIYVSSLINERLLRRITGKTDCTSLSPLTSLSDRELQVFEGIGRCKKTKVIAADLNLSIKTIETYKSNIKRKLNLQSGEELTRAAILWSVES
ncbi:response regulator transcription factor [Aliiglaciecola sp. LCG003]|uniref:response regulator transcription factor n=1 Tax=Aliiglaciecola sp. LCG003 TaxID=3053655 RepID=UPI002572379F|nr:response regulator transcription factor [Aliiglaciecola sp. LCG003]WJG09169.1 response regulator transcription factor [Aliiglaciecola sp. LCG003]